MYSSRRKGPHPHGVPGRDRRYSMPGDSLTYGYPRQTGFLGMGYRLSGMEIIYVCM